VRLFETVVAITPPRAAHPRANAGAGRWPKRCALTEKLPIVCLEALTCLTVYAVHATDACGSPLSAFARETSG
jgi:hypothetical protein